MNHKQYDNSLSLCDIDEMLKPFSEIDLSNQHSDALEHLQDQLGLIAHLVGLHIDKKETNRRAQPMSSNVLKMPKLKPRLEDFSSFNAVRSNPGNWTPRIDPDTYKILEAVLADLRGNHDFITDPIETPESWFTLSVPISILAALVEGLKPHTENE